MMTQSECRNLCFVSWNTNGIKSKKANKKKPKISEVLKSLSTLQADIAFIQETHIGPNCSEIFKGAEKENWEAFFTIHSTKSKGVAILIKKSIKFQYICHDEDCIGGYFVLFCHLYDELYTLVNVYNHKADRNVLSRLKEYLMETAEGVLVVGGDFNTVLDPHLDRKPSTSRHSQFRAILEDFTATLNLKDTWSYLNPTKTKFTRHQGKRYSRLDMFFLPEDRMRRVHKIDVKTVVQGISDHQPLVLKLRLEKQTENTIPNVATWLEKLTYIPDSRPGKISGAEILSVIKSLTDSEERRLDKLQVYTYKRYQCSLTEILKIHFNIMLKNNFLYTSFNESYPSGDRHVFNVDYLIFSQILAKRLSAFIIPSFKGEMDKNLSIMFSLTFERGEQKIRWSFLLEALQALKPNSSAPLPDFRILDCILPKVQSSGDLRSLQPGCPLTNTILNLALNYFVDKFFDFKWQCEKVGHEKNKPHRIKCKEILSMATVCYQRQVLLIHSQLKQHDKVKMYEKEFKEKSALKIIMHEISPSEQNNTNTEDS